MSEVFFDETILGLLERRLTRPRVAEVVAAQLSHGVQLMLQLSALEAAPDAHRIRAIAHQIAGSSGSIGLMGLSQRAAALELACADGPEAALAGLVADLLSVMARSFERLRELYPEAAPDRPSI